MDHGASSELRHFLSNGHSNVKIIILFSKEVTHVHYEITKKKKEKLTTFSRTEQCSAFADHRKIKKAKPLGIKN